MYIFRTDAVFFTDLIGNGQAPLAGNGQYLGSAFQVRPEELTNPEQVQKSFLIKEDITFNGIRYINSTFDALAT
jgi:hypothetical protein